MSQELGMYIHTSSASSVANIKCVPLTHGNIFSGALARFNWWKKTWPKQDFERLRVLGWSPWSHIIGISHDIGAALLLTGGSYVFGVTPSCYHVTNNHVPEGGSSDIISRLLHTARTKSTTAFAGVPWILDGIITLTAGGEEEMVETAMRQFKIFGLGGAATSLQARRWSEEHQVPLIVDIGMTELGGKTHPS